MNDFVLVGGVSCSRAHSLAHSGSPILTARAAFSQLCCRHRHETGLMDTDATTNGFNQPVALVEVTPTRWFPIYKLKGSTDAVKKRLIEAQ